MWDPKTKRTHSSRDVIWLRRMYYERPDTKREISPTVDFEFYIPETKQPETMTSVCFPCSDTHAVIAHDYA
jgi:hypothetical protein